MADYRRYFVAGGTYFFTLVTHGRRPFLISELARTCLREAIETIRKKRPFEMPAMVLLPDHLHVLWTLPSGDDKYSARLRRIKGEFTESYLALGGDEALVSHSRRVRRERGVWQRRFWEHTIRDEDDFGRHFDYIHYNAVKHDYANCPKDWPYSSFQRWVDAGVYALDWGCRSRGPLNFDDLDQTAME
jgi:putative transposase